MKLVIFDHTANRGGQRMQFRALSINRRNAKISFTRKATEELNINTEKSVIFARDDESKNDWYICLMPDQTTGIPVRAHNGAGFAKGYSTMSVTCRSLSATILDALKAKSGATILIDQTPVVIDGQEWYQLMTAKPLRLN